MTSPATTRERFEAWFLENQVGMTDAERVIASNCMNALGMIALNQKNPDALPLVHKMAKEDISAFMKQQTDDKLDSKFNEQINQLRAEGYQDEGIEKVKKTMIEQSIPNAIAAAAYLEKINPPPKPLEVSGFSPTNWGFGGQDESESTKLLFKDEDAWAEREAKLAWDDAKKNQIQS